MIEKGAGLSIGITRFARKAPSGHVIRQLVPLQERGEIQRLFNENWLKPRELTPAAKESVERMRAALDALANGG